MGCALAAVLYAALFLKDSREMRPKEALEEMEARKAMIAAQQKGGEEGDAEEANDNGWYESTRCSISWRTWIGLT